MVLVQRIHHLLHLLQAVAGLKKASEKRNKDQTIREKHNQSGTANSGAGAIYYMAKNCTGMRRIYLYTLWDKKAPLHAHHIHPFLQIFLEYEIDSVDIYLSIIANLLDNPNTNNEPTIIVLCRTFATISIEPISVCNPIVGMLTALVAI